MSLARLGLTVDLGRLARRNDHNDHGFAEAENKTDFRLVLATQASRQEGDVDMELDLLVVLGERLVPSLKRDNLI